MPTPNFERELNHNTLFVPAALVIARFFLGTTEETTSRPTFRFFKTRRRYAAVKSRVATRLERKSVVLLAKANFVNELLISIKR